MNTILKNAKVLDEDGNYRVVQVLVERNRIVRVCEEEIEEQGEVVDLWGFTLMPGFIHTHVHLVDNFDPFNAGKLKRWLKSGITYLRDQGVLSRHTAADVVEWRDRMGKSSLYPTVSVCGKFITAVNGYGGVDPIEVKDAAEARKAVREQTAAGVDHIKIAMDDGYDPGTAGMGVLGQECLAAICEEAHGFGLRVSAHVNKSSYLRDLVKAGIDEAGHTCRDMIPDELLDEMVEKEVAMTPTLSVYGEITTNWGAPFLEIAMDNVKRFADKGGVIGLGNDYIEEKPVWSPVGMPMMEIELLQKAGLGMVQIIHAATVGGARILGREDLGRIAAGCRADLIAVKGDPVKLPYLLSDVQFVMKDGIVVKRI